MFSILHEGAREQTAEEIKEVFHFPDDEVKRSSFARLHNNFNDGSSEYELSTANALWAQKDFPFLEEYFDTVEKYYGSGIANVDFMLNPDGVREVINNWVEEQTNDKIKDLFAKGAITTDTRLVITNTVYFKGEWENKFDESETRERDFYIGNEEKIQTSMMHFYDEMISFNYAETEDLQVLEMPYKGEKLSMLIFLPKDSDLNGLEANFDEGKLNEMKDSMRKQVVDISIPKFKFEAKYDKMKDELTEMGMPSAFRLDLADFSGLNGRKNLYVTHVVHKTYINVNEEGTEAAAATGIVMGGATSVLSPKNFNANHPFLFLIQDTETGTILFIGRVVNPSG